MATNFPTSLDALTNPGPTQTLDSPSHSTQHGTLNDAVEALEAKVGIDGSAVATSHDKILTLKANIASPTFTGTVTAPTFVGALTGTASNATTVTNGAITTAKLDTGAVTTAKIASSAVTTNELNNGAVTGTKIYKDINSFSGANYTVVSNDYILNHSGTSDTVVTLPNAATYAGRPLQFRNTVAFLITSATNNIVGLKSATTPRQVLGLNLILSGTEGSWCELVSNGTNWVIVNASELT